MLTPTSGTALLWFGDRFAEMHALLCSREKWQEPVRVTIRRVHELKAELTAATVAMLVAWMKAAHALREPQRATSGKACARKLPNVRKATRAAMGVVWFRPNP
jgi:hypothetical protein